MNQNQQQKRDELISILWKLKNAAANDQAFGLSDLLRDPNFRSDFIAQAANSPFSEIRHAAQRARELDSDYGLNNNGRL